MPTIQSAIDDYLYAKKDEVTAKTHRWYQQKLVVFAAWCESRNLQLEQVKATEIRQFLHSLTEQKPVPSGYTRKGYAQVVKQFIRWCALEEGYEDFVTAKSADRVEMPKFEKTIREPFSLVEVQALLAACDHEATATLRVRNKAIVYLLLDTGMRASELVFDSSRTEETTGLRLPHVFLNSEESFVRVMGKGRKERDLYIGQKTRTSLRKYITRYRGKSDTDYVFLGRAGEPLTVRGLEEMVKRLGEKANVADCFPHRFRHTFSHEFRRAGNDIHELSVILGHTSVKVTENYLQKFSGRGKYSVGDNL